MGGEEKSDITTEKSNVLEQDFSELTTNKVSTISCEVNQRQVVINIGNIRHEAVSKFNAPVYNLSEAQTVRFKSEMGNNMKLKLEACTIDNNQGERAEIPASTATIPFICDKRPISPGSCHPTAKQPKIEKTKYECQESNINHNSQSCIKFLNYSSNSQQFDTTFEISESNTKTIPNKINKFINEHEMNLKDSNIFNNLCWKEVRIKLKDIKKHNYNLVKDLANKDVYEVEKVLGKKIENNTTFYLIKWKNWNAQYNTWEPIENLTNCLDCVKDFEDGRLKSLEEFQKCTNFYPDTGLIERHMQELFNKGKDVDVSAMNTDLLYERIQKFLSAGPNKCIKLAEKIKKNILQMLLYQARTEQLASLADWENEMNNITKGKPSIKVENTVDLECAPQEFLYIDDYLPGSGVIIPEEPPIGCECSTCNSKTKCCYAMCDGSFPYTSACRIRVPPGTPIYECNKRCVCSNDCQNRVVQRGSQMKLCVFRTSNGRGWGVKTLRVIKKGTFVIQYVGEVITNEEAEKRGKEYDAAGRTYLFDLDYNETEGQCPYTVDAAIYGNISHFINHSCDPNLAVYAVWINCLDPNLPKLALFATRDIKQNEEITFDYMCQTTKDDVSRQRLGLPNESINDKSLESRTRCKCGANICRQYLF